METALFLIRRNANVRSIQSALASVKRGHSGNPIWSLNRNGKRSVNSAPGPATDSSSAWKKSRHGRRKSTFNWPVAHGQWPSRWVWAGSGTVQIRGLRDLQGSERLVLRAAVMAGILHRVFQDRETIDVTPLRSKFPCF